MDLPGQLKKNRERLGLSQDDVSSRIYVSRQTLSSWENGKTYPDVQSLMLLSQLFDVSIDELILGDLAVMQKNIEEDSVKAKWLLVIAGVAMVLGIAFLAVLTTTLQQPSDLRNFTVGNLIGIGLFVPLYVIALVALMAMERIKRRHDAKTVKEIEALLRGEMPDEDSRDTEAFSRTHQRAAIVLKFLVGALIGGIIAWVLFNLS